MGPVGLAFTVGRHEEVDALKHIEVHFVALVLEPFSSPVDGARDLGRELRRLGRRGRTIRVLQGIKKKKKERFSCVQGGRANRMNVEIRTESDPRLMYILSTSIEQFCGYP